MELEHNWDSKQTVSSSHVETTSESTLPTRRLGAPIFIPPIHPESKVRPQKGISIKGESDLKGSTSHGLTKERVSQVQSNDTRRNRKSVRENIPLGNGGGGDSSGDFQVKKGVLPEEMVTREEEEVMMILTPVIMGMEMILPPQTPLPQGGENIKVLNMCM